MTNRISVGIRVGTRVGIKVLCTAALTVLLAAVAGSAAAQSKWGSDAADTNRSSNGSQSTRPYDDRSKQGYDKYIGPYVQFGIAVGKIDFDDGIDTDAGGGFSMTGGYRALSWLSGEANVTYLGGGDAKVGSNNSGNAEFFAFTFGPKVYPLAAFEQEVIPEFVQPYGLIAIGGGEFEINGINGGDREKSSFIARFIFGMDFWITDHVGAYIEGGYHAADDDDVDGAGVFTFGGQYRF